MVKQIGNIEQKLLTKISTLWPKEVTHLIPKFFLAFEIWHHPSSQPFTKRLEKILLDWYAGYFDDFT